MPTILNIPTTYAADELPTRWHEAADMPNGDHYWQGVFTDWQDDRTRQTVWELRASGQRPTHQRIAAALNLQGPRRSNRAGDAWARRVRADIARGTAPHTGATDHRSYSMHRAWTQAAEQAATVGTRAFGVEIECNYPGAPSMYDRHPERARAIDSVLRAMSAYDVHDRRLRYGWDGNTGGHQATLDTTVNGMEWVTPPLAGDDDSMVELRTAFAAIRDAGFTHASTDGYGHNGLHVSHNVNDFNAEDKSRLVGNLRNVADNLRAFNGSLRQSSRWAQPLSAHDWDDMQRRINIGRPGMDDHGVEFNFANVNSGQAARVEFRGWGNSLNFTKTRVWIRVGQAVMTATKAGVTIEAGLSQAAMIDLLKQHGLSDWAAAKWLTRTTG